MFSKTQILLRLIFFTLSVERLHHLVSVDSIQFPYDSFPWSNIECVVSLQNLSLSFFLVSLGERMSNYIFLTISNKKDRILLRIFIYWNPVCMTVMSLQTCNELRWWSQVFRTSKGLSFIPDSSTGFRLNFYFVYRYTSVLAPFFSISILNPGNPEIHSGYEPTDLRIPPLNCNFVYVYCLWASFFWDLHNSAYTK